MSETSAVADSGVPIGVIGQIVGIFALAGVGIGATGGVAMSQLGGGSGMGGAIISGILVLVVMTVAFLLGPIIGLISGLRVGADRGRTSESYLAGLLGSVAGYFVMILLVVLAMSAVMAMGAGGGGSGAAADTASQTSATSGDSSGGLPIGEYIVPIIAVALPTGLTGLGGVFLGGDGAAASSGITLPTRYIAATIIVVGVVAAGAMVVPDLLSPDPQVEVEGSASATQDTLFAEALVTNPTDSDITTTMTVELVISDEVVATEEREVTVRGNVATDVRWRMVTTSELSESQIRAVNNGEMELRYIIKGETVDTYTGGV